MTAGAIPDQNAQRAHTRRHGSTHASIAVTWRSRGGHVAVTWRSRGGRSLAVVAEEGLCGFRLRPAVRLRPEDPYQCVCVCARARACVRVRACVCL